jgi:oligopeptide transport system permease protein
MATRVQVMYVKNREYNIMSGLLGTPSSKIITKNILPKVMPVLVSVAAFAIPDAIALDATLSYLNFGFVDGSINTSLGFIIQSVSMTTS